MKQEKGSRKSINVNMPPKYWARKPLSSVPGKFVAGILAAGVARRLEPISSILAKPMFPLGGDFPICQNWVERLERVGIRQIGMNLHAVPISITDHFGDGSAFLTDISYVHEAAAPSGTLGGAIKIMERLEESLGPAFDTIIVPSGDVISEMSDDDFMAMLAFHKQNGAAATLLLTPVAWHTLGEFGTVELEGIKVSRDRAVDNASYARIETFNEKDPNAASNLVNASCYIFERSFLEALRPFLTECTPDRDKVPQPFYDFGQHVFPAMLGKLAYRPELAKYGNALFGFVSNALWFDIGRKRDYLEVNKSALLGHIGLHVPYAKMPGGYFLGVNTRIAENVTIVPPVIIGNDCEISAGATIGPNTVIGSGWKVGRGSSVVDTVAWQHYSYTNIPNLRQIGENLAIEKCILVGGVVEESLREKVVDLRADGQVVTTGIDVVPTLPRA